MPKFDEAMVERLAWELFKNTQCPSLPDSEIELRTLAHPELWDSCKADAETVLTALSETHFIIPKPTGEERLWLCEFKYPEEGPEVVVAATRDEALEKVAGMYANWKGFYRMDNPSDWDAQEITVDGYEVRLLPKPEEVPNA